MMLRVVYSCASLCAFVYCVFSFVRMSVSLVCTLARKLLQYPMICFMFYVFENKLVLLFICFSIIFL